MKHLSRMTTMFTIMLTALFAIASCKTEEKIVKVTKVELNTPAVSLTVGQNVTLTATVSPVNAANKSVRWESSDQTIATVDQQGNVVAVTAGEATITAKSTDGGHEAACSVTIVAATPNNGFTYAGVTSPVGWGEVKDEYYEGLYDQWHIQLAVRPLAEGNAYPRCFIQVPKARAGKLIDLKIKNEKLDDYWYVKIMPNAEDIFSGDEISDFGEFIGGHLKYQWDGKTLFVDVKVELQNGNTFELYYDGELPKIQRPTEIPEYDETLNNEWQYDGGKKVAVNWVAFRSVEAPYTGLFFDLSDAAPAEGDLPINLLETYVAADKFGTEITMVEDNSGDPWGVEFILNRGIEAYYKGWGNDLNTVGTGKMIMTKEGNVITLKLAVVFMNKKILRAKFSGEAAEWKRD